MIERAASAQNEARSGLDKRGEGCFKEASDPRWSQERCLAQRQRAEISLMFGSNAGLRASADISNGGLLSIAALVSGVLLTTTVLVHVAMREGKRPRWPV